MKNILVTGGNGQLANCIKETEKNFTHLNFVYVDFDEMDITDFDSVSETFKKNDFSYCINCAAYTAVDNAESDFSLAERVNVIGPKNLSLVCDKEGVVLIHISTDFVFDGCQTKFYTEDDEAKPLSVYGRTKFDGEMAIAETLKEYFILRTSWLYSENGHNFLKTMLRLGKERDSISVVHDQIGTPTYAGDLANMLIKIIDVDFKQFGLYHFSNEGVASWYDFAKAIFDISGLDVEVHPISTESYPLPATRPKFSVMDKTKIKNCLEINIPYWRDSLSNCFKGMDFNLDQL